MRKRFLPSEEYVKVMGRTVMLDDCRLLCTSGSGVEFRYNGSRLAVSFYGDSSTDRDMAEGDVEGEASLVRWRDIARVLVLVDGRIMLDTAIKDKKETFVVYGEETSTPYGEHHVRIIKLSEPRMSSVGLGEIVIDTEGDPVPEPDREKYVEFIGDSITCGYGVDTDNELCPFSTCTENASRAYAYLAANELNADYSLVSYSGHGLLSGWTPDPNVPKKEELVQPYYDLVAYSYHSFRGLQPQNYKWTFDRQPDVIVINLGTNDGSYTLDDSDKIKAYEQCYLEFLATVRKYNPKAHIICALGVMGDDLYPAVERVTKKFGDNISALHLTPHNPEVDQLAADYHPSPATQRRAADEMIQELKKWLCN